MKRTGLILLGGIAAAILNVLGIWILGVRPLTTTELGLLAFMAAWCGEQNG